MKTKNAEKILKVVVCVIVAVVLGAMYGMFWADEVYQDKIDKLKNTKTTTPSLNLTPKIRKNVILVKTNE